LVLVWSTFVRSGGAGGPGWHVIPARVEAALVALARHQHGVLATSQLRAAGLGPHAISGRVARGRLQRLHCGVYVVGALGTALTKPAAALVATGPSAGLSHRTAATLWEILPPRPDDPIHITLLNANRRPRQGSESTTRSGSRREEGTASA
jgi:hypothetical protein